MTDPRALPAELAVFEKDAGVWDATVEIRISPGAEPLVSKGVSTNRLAYGGRWLITDFENETGFGGHGVYGFDVVKKKYTGVWVDPSRTTLAVMDGVYDAATRTMTMTGEMKKPNGETLAWRETTERVDADTQIFRSFVPGPDGVAFELMTVTYRRRASA
jgi:hypothetical protein